MNEKKESFFEEFLEDRFLFYMDEWSRKCDPDKKIMVLEKEDHLKEILKKISKEDSCFLTEYIEEILTQNAEEYEYYFRSGVHDGAEIVLELKNIVQDEKKGD